VHAVTSPSSSRSLDIKLRHNRTAYAFAVDFEDPAVPAQLVQNIQQSVGPIDILLNIPGNVGLSSFAHTADFQSEWWHTLELNLRAPIALIHAVLPSMLARGSGIVITTTQSNGVLSVPFMTADSTARSAMIRFHHGLDHEVRPKGVYTYVVFPGTVASYMHDPDAVQNVDHFTAEPRLESEMTSVVAGVVMEAGGWCGVGLASGTFVTLCADPRARCLSGLYVDAERDLGEMIEEVEKGTGNRVETERLYMLKVDEL
jgi:short-subunit dehydrogenase